MTIRDLVPDCAIDGFVMDHEDMDDFQQPMAAINNTSSNRCTSNPEQEWREMFTMCSLLRGSLDYECDVTALNLDCGSIAWAIDIATLLVTSVFYKTRSTN